jgi:hypothetical protein
MRRAGEDIGLHYSEKWGWQWHGSDGSYKSISHWGLFGSFSGPSKFVPI